MLCSGNMRITEASASCTTLQLFFTPRLQPSKLFDCLVLDQPGNQLCH